MNKKLNKITLLFALFFCLGTATGFAQYDEGGGDDDWDNDYDPNSDNPGDLDPVIIVGSGGGSDDDDTGWDDDDYDDDHDDNDGGSGGNSGGSNNTPIPGEFNRSVSIPIPAINTNLRLRVKLEPLKITIAPIVMQIPVIPTVNLMHLLTKYNSINSTTLSAAGVQNQANAVNNHNAQMSSEFEAFMNYIQNLIIQGYIDDLDDSNVTIEFDDCDGSSYCTSVNSGIRSYWYLDNDGDGYYSDLVLSSRSPGNKWIKSHRGIDCDDTVHADVNGNDCGDPCKSTDGKKADPLVDIQVLGTKNNGINGGLYGNGRGRFHDGTDFVAPVGTPIYSMFDGVVDFSITSHFEGEEWVNKNSWSGDKNAAGNRIYITSTVDSNKLQFGYWHLSTVNINPNTGKAYKSGDLIKQGAIIGFSGSTGNANSPDSAGPHLHLRGRKNGNKYNPLESFQSTIDTVTGKGSCK